MTSVYTYYAHVDMNAMISQTIVSSYDFICSDIRADLGFREGGVGVEIDARARKILAN